MSFKLKAVHHLMLCVDINCHTIYSAELDGTEKRSNKETKCEEVEQLIKVYSVQRIGQIQLDLFR